jgi:hypothetical protein
MTAIKKTTNKSTKSPAPAAKTTRTRKPAAVEVPAQAAADSAALAVAALSVAAAPKSVASKPVVTTITACIDIGFGNSLYIRGEGPGLSWDKGVPMSCVGPDQWQVVLGESARPYLVKFLVNDLTWSTGPDYTVPSGVNLTLAPQF